jgi:hypothetical protein
MQSKDYIAIASAFKKVMPKIDYLPVAIRIKTQWCMDVQAIADVLEQDNEQFNRKMFLKSCGLIGE